MTDNGPRFLDALAKAIANEDRSAMPAKILFIALVVSLGGAVVMAVAIVKIWLGLPVN